MGRYTGKKVLVTGGTGFIGSRLAERLAFEEGAEVTVLVNNWSKATWVSRLPIRLLKGSINNVRDLSQAMEDCSIVFHCVGLGGTLEEAMKINVDGTDCVLEAAKQQGVGRVVYFSSAVVHGPATRDGMNENAPMNETGDAYADSKIEAEKLFWRKTKELGIEGVVLRPTYVWGVNSLYYTIDFINQMKAKTFTWVDDGLGKCNAVHIDNVVDVAIISGLHEKAAGESFLIADGEDLSWRDFYGHYAKMIHFSLDDALSVYSSPGLANRSMYLLKKLLVGQRDWLTTSANKLESRAPTAAKFLFKAPRKLIKQTLNPIEKRYPEVAGWDLLAYGSTGRINLSKLKELLDYKPQKSVAKGMEECQVWLRDQNYIQD